MNGIYEYMLLGTSIDFNDIKSDKVIIAETSNEKFTITRFENGSVIILISKSFIPLINQYIEAYSRDLFSKKAINFIKEHFHLENTQDPWEYIYGITILEELQSKNVKYSVVKIELEELKTLNSNEFKKYPFRNPSEELIYFGIYEDKKIVSLVSGYIGQFNAIELTGETLQGYRNRGFAKSNTLFITKYLLENGYEVMTTNGANNIASIQTVESLSFKKYGRRLAFFGSTR